jgi:hypothetical protein
MGAKVSTAPTIGEVVSILGGSLNALELSRALSHHHCFPV